MDSLRSAYAGRRVAVTGGAGFIGSRLAARLAGLGAEVAVLDSFAPGSGADPRNLPAAESARPGRIELHRGDLRDRDAAGAALSGAAAIFHLAAANGHRESMIRPTADYEGNLASGVALFAAASARAPAARVVFAGTRQIYAPAGPEPGRRLPATEAHPISPPDVHGVHKEAVEHLGRHWARTGPGSFSVLRLTNTYGPRQPLAGPGAGFTGTFLAQALAGDEIEILGPPGLLRDLVQVDDAVDAFLLAGTPTAPAGTWNLGADPVTLEDFARAVFRALGRPPRLRFAPLPPGLAGAALGDFHSDWSAIHRDLGWSPRRPLDEGLAETVRHFLRPGASPAASPPVSPSAS